MRTIARGAVCLLLGASAAFAQGGYEILDMTGHRVDGPVLSLAGTPERPAEGDLMEVFGFHLVLGPPGRYILHRRDGRLTCGRKLVGLVVTGTELEDLTDAERETLRGIWIRQWSTSTAVALRKLDLSRVAITISPFARRDGTLPLLPRDTRYLVLRKANPDAEARLSLLTGLTALRLRHCDLPVAAFVGATGLRALEIQRMSPEDAPLLGKLTELRHLDMDGADLGVLPPIELPHLKTLSLLPWADGTRPTAAHASLAAQEAVEAFLRRNPCCRLRRSWAGRFREAMAGVDRIRLRTGGSSASSEKQATTLFEITDPAEIQAFFDCLSVVEERSGFHCMCGGDSTFELYMGERRWAVLSFHHNSHVRWDRGEWPGDAVLTDDSVLALGAFLARHGVPEPLEQIRASLAAEAAWYVRSQKVSVALGRDLAVRLGETRTWSEFREELVLDVPDPVERVLLVFQVLASNEDSWDCLTGRQAGMVRERLRDEPVRVLEADALPVALRRAARDPLVRRGAARWLLGLEGWKTVPPEVLEEVLPALAASAFRHPRLYSRRRALAALVRIDTPAAWAAIRALLENETTLRPVPEDEEPQCREGDVSLPQGMALDLDGTDREAAKRALERRGPPPPRPR